MAFAVEPKRDCPHVSGLDYSTFSAKDIKIDSPCSEEGCGAQGENWVCCFCGAVLCSRYVKGHAAKHAETNPDHCISVSFADCSCWCYKCDSYIDDPVSRMFVSFVQRIKFGVPDESPEKSAGPLKEVTTLKDQTGLSFTVQDTKRGDGLCLDTCSACIIDIKSPVHTLRLLNCKSCTIQVGAPVTFFAIEHCVNITIRHNIDAHRSCMAVNDSAPVALLIPFVVSPDTFFYSFETKGSVVGINAKDKPRFFIPAGPLSATTFDGKNAFETKPVEEKKETKPAEEKETKPQEEEKH